MRRWKQDCRLRNEAGFTLVELLASLAVLSLIIGLIGSVTMFGLKQYDQQVYVAEQSNDYAYALTVLSKEVRSAEEVVISAGSITVDGVVFAQSGSQLVKTTQSGKEILADNVKTGGFQVVENTDKTIVITLENAQTDVNQKMYDTTIYLRR